MHSVVLHAEDVDWNIFLSFAAPIILLSSSMRRTWIEILGFPVIVIGSRGRPPCGGRGLKYIACCNVCAIFGCRPPCGGRGLKCWKILGLLDILTSSSMRRTWIEIFMHYGVCCPVKSRPPCGGRGLKCQLDCCCRLFCVRRPPCGGRGLKLIYPDPSGIFLMVVLHAEDVDWNFLLRGCVVAGFCRPPCGGRGLKYSRVFSC